MPNSVRLKDEKPLLDMHNFLVQQSLKGPAAFLGVQDGPT